ncbi:MAG: hypothetical protein KJO32_14630 [Deltaproteobacteria bacterium]|nr:hypothetical protein [Deltaproteobacteria bacterium]
MPIVEMAPTRVPKIIPDTPVLDNERSASEKSAVEFTDTERFMINKAISPKVTI